METKVSTRGQTVVPNEIRKALGITPKSRLRWTLNDGFVVVFPIPEDPVRASIGIFRDKGPSVDDVVEERRRERERERARERTMTDAEK